MGLQGTTLKAFTFTTITSIWLYLFIILQARITEAKIGKYK